MERRRFLGLTILAPGWLALRKLDRQASVMATAPREVSFHVAGVRFYPGANVRTGDPVQVERAIFKGERCFQICAPDGGQIGYIPKQLIPLVCEARIVDARVSSADRYAVPWKRYEVTLALS